MSSEVKRYDAYGNLVLPGDPEQLSMFVLATDYAALEAENARLKREVSHWQGLAVTNRRVADDALAQLAAIQQAKGEEDAEKQLQEWARDKFSFAGRYKGSVYGNTDWSMARAIHTDLLAHYQRITAAMAAEAERKTASRDKLAAILRDLVPGCKWRIMRPRIDAALLEIENGD